MWIIKKIARFLNTMCETLKNTNSFLHTLGNKHIFTTVQTILSRRERSEKPILSYEPNIITINFFTVIF